MVKKGSSIIIGLFIFCLIFFGIYKNFTKDNAQVGETKGLYLTAYPSLDCYSTACAPIINGSIYVNSLAEGTLEEDQQVSLTIVSPTIVTRTTLKLDPNYSNGSVPTPTKELVSERKIIAFGGIGVEREWRITFPKGSEYDPKVVFTATGDVVSRQQDFEEFFETTIWSKSDTSPRKAPKLIAMEEGKTTMLEEDYETGITTSNLSCLGGEAIVDLNGVTTSVDQCQQLWFAINPGFYEERREIKDLSKYVN